jgi:hypothetical protein
MEAAGGLWVSEQLEKFAISPLRAREKYWLIQAIH